MLPGTSAAITGNPCAGAEKAGWQDRSSQPEVPARWPASASSRDRGVHNGGRRASGSTAGTHSDPSSSARTSGCFGVHAAGRAWQGTSRWARSTPSHMGPGIRSDRQGVGTARKRAAPWPSRHSEAQAQCGLPAADCVNACQGPGWSHAANEPLVQASQSKWAGRLAPS